MGELSTYRGVRMDAPLGPITAWVMWRIAHGQSVPKWLVWVLFVGGVLYTAMLVIELVKAIS